MKNPEMTFLLVPHKVSSTTATVWVGAIDEDVRAKNLTLMVSGESYGESLKLDTSDWQVWKTQHPLDRDRSQSPSEIRKLYYQRVTVGYSCPLKPRTAYSVELRVDGEETNYRCKIRTLPANLPDNEKPFTILLGSCFYEPNDPQGLVGKTYRYLPEDERPEIKILCGDQVYLDNPWKELTYRDFFRFIKPQDQMREIFFKKYLDTWFQVTEEGGFNRLLSDGANYFCSDDHEFWNNAPDFGGAGAINTLIIGQREWWFREAAELFRAFQSPSPLTEINVPPLSILIADTRINRHPNLEKFMEDDDLRAVGRWINNLKGPGVLVLGQLVLANKIPERDLRRIFEVGPIDFVRESLDMGLPDYAEQYNELLGYIRSSQHSIVVLTGDVHFGRVAVCELNPELKTKFIEVVSSPMQVVTNEKGEANFGDSTEAPAIFPKLQADIEFAKRENHFVTIEFSSAGESETSMKVKCWRILRPGESVGPQSAEVFTSILH